MSADNYLLIRQEADIWTGYMESASVEQPSYTTLVFKVFSLKDAIVHAQSLDTEYGYRFEGNGFDSESYFPRICECCGNVEVKSASKA